MNTENKVLSLKDLSTIISKQTKNINILPQTLQNNVTMIKKCCFFKNCDSKSAKAVLCACKYGHLDCLQFFKNINVNDEVKDKMMKFAIKYRHFDCVKYMIDENIKISLDVIEQMIKNNNIDAFKFVLNQLKEKDRLLSVLEHRRFPLSATNLLCSLNRVKFIEELRNHNIMLHSDFSDMPKLIKNGQKKCFDLVLSSFISLDEQCLIEAIRYCPAKVKKKKNDYFNVSKNITMSKYFVKELLDDGIEVVTSLSIYEAIKKHDDTLLKKISNYILDDFDEDNIIMLDKKTMHLIVDLNRVELIEELRDFIYPKPAYEGALYAISKSNIGILKEIMGYDMVRQNDWYELITYSFEMFEKSSVNNLKSYKCFNYMLNWSLRLMLYKTIQRENENLFLIMSKTLRSREVPDIHEQEVFELSYFENKWDWNTFENLAKQVQYFDKIKIEFEKLKLYFKNGLHYE